MRAVILAAGTGSRLGARTANRPKCLVEFAGRPLVRWQLDALRSAGLSDITLVTGFEAAQLQFPGVNTAHNPAYATTNMVTSLMCARAAFDGSDDVLIAYGDIVYEPRLPESLAAPTTDLSVIVDTKWHALWQVRMDDPLADAETLRIDGVGNLTELGRKPTSLADIEAQYIGMIGVKASFAQQLVTAYDALDPNETYEGRSKDQMYMTSFLQHFIDTGVEVRAVPTASGWIEVDTESDLQAYDALIASSTMNTFINLASIT